MPWDDDFLDELQASTGLTPAQLVEVVLQLPANAAELVARQRAAEVEQRQRDREAAVTKARTLLLAHLDADQRASFEAGNKFFVTSSEGNRFCVHLGRQHNVWLVDTNNQHTTNFCVHVRDQVPDEDNVLAQMLLIQSNEAEFRRVANAR